VIIAGLRRNLAPHQPACRLEIQHEDLRLQQAGMHPAAFAGAMPLE